MSAGRWLRLELGLSAVLVALAVFVRAFLEADDGTAVPNRLFATLFAAAFLCVAALARRGAPRAAGFMVVLSSTIAAIEIVGGLRGGGQLDDAGSQLAALALAVSVFVAVAATATWYAAGARGPAPLGRWERGGILAVAGAGVATVAAGIWALSTAGPVAVAVPTIASPEVAPIRWVGRLALVAAGAGLAVGALRDLAPGLARAWPAWRARGSQPADLGTLARLVADEVLPGRRSSAERTRDEERARIAADLHAHVLPDLRRAAAAADAVVAPDDLRAGLRRALEDVERLMAGRQSVVLEEFGLVAALEWLAERTEQAGGLRVELDLAGDRVDEPTAVPSRVARAAFRIAMLALDNTVRHAAATTATVRVALDDAGLILRVSDDGSAPVTPPRLEGRGLRDMSSEAAASSGSLVIEPPPGMAVTVTWPRPWPA